MVTEWIVMSSHLIAVPPTIWAMTIPELRSQVQRCADERIDEKVGPIEYRYELDERDEFSVVHCYFRGKNGKIRRFMKLRRADLCRAKKR